MSDDMPVKIKEEPGPQGYPDEDPGDEPDSGSSESPEGRTVRSSKSLSPRQTFFVNPDPHAKCNRVVMVPARSSAKIVKGSPPKSTPQRQTFFVKPPPQGAPMPSCKSIVDQLLQSGLLKHNARVITNTGEVLKEGIKGGDEVLLYFGSQNQNQNFGSKPTKTSQGDSLVNSNLTGMEKSGMTFVVPTCVPGKKGPGATKQVLVVHPPKSPGTTMTSILKTPMVSTGPSTTKCTPSLTSTPISSVPRNPPCLSLLKTPPALTPFSPIPSESSPNLSNVSNPHVLGTVESIQAQAKAAMNIMGAVNKPRESILSSLVREVKSTPPKLHPIRDQKLVQSPESPCRLFQIENVTSLVNGDAEERTQNEQKQQLYGENVQNGKEKVINEEIETLTSHGSIFGLMRAFYTVTVPDHKPTAYKQFFCNFCKCKTWDQQVFLDHITTHLFVCGRCSFKSFSRADVVSHIIKKHPEEKGELPSLHAMHLENVNLQFKGSKDGEKTSVSNALAGTDITKAPKEDSLPVIVKSAKGNGQEEFKDYLEKNAKMADNEVIYVPPEKDDDEDDDNDDTMEVDDDDTKNSSSSTPASPPKLEEERGTLPLKELGSITGPKPALSKLNPEKKQPAIANPIRLQYQCTNCDFSVDSIEAVKEHFIKVHAAKSQTQSQAPTTGYKTLPMKYYGLICPYCMLQMHDPEEMAHHLQLRHGEMLRKLVIAIRPVTNGPYTYVCSQCGASSPVKENMLGHILLEHETEHLLDTLLYIYKAGVQRFIEHIRELIRQTFNYEQFNFPDMPELVPESASDYEGSQSSSVLSQDDLEFVVLQDDLPKDGVCRNRSPTRVKVIQHYDNSSWNCGTIVSRRAKRESPLTVPKTLKDLPEAEVMFLEETPPELLMDPRPHYEFNSALKRASCKKCAFVTYGTNAQTHVREHVTGIHFRGRIWGCPYCPSLRMRRAEIIRHVVVSHPELPVKIVRRKPYEQHASLSAVVSKKTLVTSRVNSPARERLECWQCPFCQRRDASWSLMVNHLRYVHIDQEFKPVKWLRPTPKVNLEETPEVMQEIAKMKPFVLGIRVEDMKRYPPLQEVLNMEDTVQSEPSRSLMLNDSVSNKNHKFGCKLCGYTFATVLEIKKHMFAHHPGEELAIRDFRASKAPKGQTETTLFLCPGCEFASKMVKAIQVHSIKYPAHFANIGNGMSLLHTDDSVKSVRLKGEPSRGVKRKQTARKSTALPHVPPAKKQKASRMCARKSTAKPSRLKKSPPSENGVESEEMKQREQIAAIEVNPEIPEVPEKTEKPEKEEKMDIEITTVDDIIIKPETPDPPTEQSSPPENDKYDAQNAIENTMADETAKQVDDKPVSPSNESAREQIDEKPVVPSNEATTDQPQEEVKFETKPRSEAQADFPTDHLYLKCSICQMYSSTGVKDMKKHVIKKHRTMIPVAIDLVAKEAKKPQRLHICTQKGCPYVTYREWEFKGHIQQCHEDGVFGFDVSLLHDGHVIRRNLWRSVQHQPKPPRKKSPSGEEKDRKDISEFMRKRHEIGRNRSRNSESGPSPGDRRSERVTRLNARLSNSGEEANDSAISNFNESAVSDINQSTISDINESAISNINSTIDSQKDKSGTDSEKDSDPGDIQENTEDKVIKSPQPPDPVHEPGREGSDRTAHKKKKSKKKKKSSKHRKSKSPVVITDPDGRRKVLYPYQGVDSVSVRYKCFHCEFTTNDMNALRNHLQQHHFQMEQKAVDLRRKAARQRSGLFFCPTATCRMHSYEYEKYRCHECTQDLSGEDTLYQCKTCHLTTRELSEMEVHLEEHPAGYMLVDANNVSKSFLDAEDSPSKSGPPGSLLGSALFKENDFLT